MRRFILLLSSAFLLAACTFVKPDVPVSTATPIVESYPTSYTLSISLPGKPIASESAHAKKDETALSALSRVHKVQTKHFSFGDTVNAIDQILSGTDGRYWIMYVNGKMSEVGADEYIIKDGDVIVWKFQKEGEKL